MKHIKAFANFLHKGILICFKYIVKKIDINRVRILYDRNSLGKVLKGIPDVIGVYDTDHTILLYNQAGYEFFQIDQDGIKGKKCYEMLYRKHQCPNCPVDNAIDTKQVVTKERYVNELGKYIYYCCNPVMDKKGKVLFVVEQLRDISDKKRLELILKESGNNYRKIVNLSPDAIVIIIDGIIVLANRQAMEHIHNPIGESLEKYITSEYSMSVSKGIDSILKNKADKMLFECKLVLKDNSISDVEISSSYISYKGKPAVLALIRDISDRK